MRTMTMIMSQLISLVLGRKQAADHAPAQLVQSTSGRCLDHTFDYVNLLFGTMDPEAVFTFTMDTNAVNMLTFVTVQMTAKQGLKHFCSVGAEAIMHAL